MISEPGHAHAERRQLTVTFVDLAGSTELSGRLDPEDFRNLILRYQDAVKTVIDRHDGYIARFLGDGVLVYYGYPRAHENDAERAVRSGLDIIDAVSELKSKPGNVSTDRLAVRIGIMTGHRCSATSLARVLRRNRLYSVRYRTLPPACSR